MEIGETVADVESPDEEEGGCPFEHEPRPEDDNTENELAGYGSKLGENMNNGVGVWTRYKEKVGKDPDPGCLTVKLKVRGAVVKLNEKPLPYPLVCAAHHLIPAQASLRDHPLLKFMCKKGDDQNFLKNGNPIPPRPVSGSKVWANVGYNVNGVLNGVWAPGSYAVAGGEGRVDVWNQKRQRQRDGEEKADTWGGLVAPEAWTPTTDTEEGEEPMPVTLAEALKNAPLREYALYGANLLIRDDNPKWRYVKAAMDEREVQFHDSHEDYSDLVVKYLNKIVTAYKKMYKRFKRDGECPDCNPEGADPELVGPPTDLIARLVRCSEFFRRHLEPEDQTITANNIYTSKWVKAWISERVKEGKVIELPRRP